MHADNFTLDHFHANYFLLHWIIKTSELQPDTRAFTVPIFRTYIQIVLDFPVRRCSHVCKAIPKIKISFLMKERRLKPSLFYCV